MKNFDEILRKLVDEQDFMKQMQQRIVENYDIMIQNQQQNADNHEMVIQNQTTIIRNQEIIVNNQMNIVRNQKQIAQNQITLDVIQKTQTHILNYIKKLSGQEEDLNETVDFVLKLRAESEANRKGQNLNESATL
jgi:translation initiation factor 2 beta subunit (eIF-2beta)/eIF-5